MLVIFENLFGFGWGMMKLEQRPALAHAFSLNHSEDGQRHMSELEHSRSGSLEHYHIDLLQLYYIDTR